MNVQPIGSEFAWCGPCCGTRIAWPQPHALFGLGRDTVIAVRGKGVQGGSRLWVPTFFCPQVVKAWQRSGLRIERYPDDPRRAEPDWNLLAPKRHDAVLAINYFGTRSKEPWRAWQERCPNVLLIEDHTHDPLSRWALTSEADFAFASLRKTLPVPDGAILWSPKAHRLPQPPTCHDWNGSALKLAGMIWKREFLEHAASVPDQPPAYRQFELDGEEALEAGVGLSISPWSRAWLQAGLPQDWRQQREANVRQFVQSWQVSDLDTSPVKLLFRQWPTGHCPFNPVLLFQNAEARDRCRREMIAAKIFPPIHWPQDEGADKATLELSQRLLTVPLDARCGEHDVTRVVTCIRDAVESYSASRASRIHLYQSA